MEDWSPTITAREYVSALDTSLGALGEGRVRARYKYPLGLRYLATGLPGPAALVFSELVQRYPTDEHARRLLGIAYLSWGQLEPAVKHLEIALALLRRKAAGAVGFAETLRFQCEAALLRFVLVRLHMRLGEVEAAQWLVKEAQEIL
ncbi:MAG: hypothetical protein HY002_00655 [Candidatus Rokubacteria bacterium]|nr:hypothetical protein [Candidatus Rokubacteria bacterium]